MQMKKKKKPGRPQLPRGEYDKLRRSAYELVVVQGKDQKKTAEQLGVSEVTLSKWSTEGKWRDERQSRQLCISTDNDNTRKLMRLLSDNRYQLELDIINAEKAGDSEKQIELRKKARAISDEISKHNKTLISLERENKATLGVYIDVFDDIFTALRVYDEELFLKTIDFQAQHIRRKTSELG
jgi:hypothetical protein